MNKEDKEIKRSVKIIWERDYYLKDGGTCTKRDIVGRNKTKEDILDAIVDIMETGKVNIVDLLLHLSPKML